ncbi:MAG: right-handed parallel beta-helix repeat-containing protein, partial [Candidatus Thermoplasmatota archaeon]
MGLFFFGLLAILAITSNAYTPHDPIHINGNSQFTPENGVVAGNGTASDPYIIEGWDIDASNAIYGIKIENTNAYFIIRNCNVHGTSCAADGIRFHNVTNGKIENCNIYNNYVGIILEYSSNNNIISNTFTNDGIIIGGNSLEHFNTHTIQANTVNGKPLYYYKNESGIIIDNIPVGQLILANCTNFTIKNLSINNTNVGIELAYSSNNNITNCNVYNNSWWGIVLLHSSNNNIITNCNVYNNSYHGIYLYSSSNNNITNCNIYNNSRGIYLYNSSNNLITNCRIYGVLRDIILNEGDFAEIYYIGYFENGTVFASSFNTNVSYNTPFDEKNYNLTPLRIYMGNFPEKYPEGWSYVSLGN